MTKGVRQLRAVQDVSAQPTVDVEPVVILDESGNPVKFGGGSSGPSQSDFNALAARVDALENAGE